MQEEGNRSGAEDATYVVGDVHGHREELVAALTEAGLVDTDADGVVGWCGGTARLWFLGDFFDRGPDGVGVVDLVMDLAEQADEQGGTVQALLGNHEILALGMYTFGETEVPSEFGARSFGRSWRLNGGQQEDQDGLTDKQVSWLLGRPVLALDGEHLLMHSDTIEYFNWGETIEEINAAVREVLASADIVEWWECWRRMTTRYAFRGPEGAEIAEDVLANLGGGQIVHGHSVIADQLGVAPDEVDGPHLYAQGLVLGVDGGLFVGGPCLVVPLPWTEGPSVVDFEGPRADFEGPSSSE